MAVTNIEAAELKKYLREQLDELRQENAELRAEIDRVDDWANGIHVALQQSLIFLLAENPDTARKLEPVWRKKAEDYERLDSQGLSILKGSDGDVDQPIQQFESIKMLYRILEVVKVWPSQSE